MDTKIECPYCDGQAILKTSNREASFRKESFFVEERYYVCQKCKEEFTTTEVDTFTMTQLYNQYREKHNTPFPSEIRTLREQYSLPASSMSIILGLGINSYSNYEKGEMPSQANANLIKTAKDPKVFKLLLKDAKDKLGVRVFNRTSQVVQELIEKKENAEITHCFYNFSLKFSQYNGYSNFNLEKIGNLATLFLTQCQKEFNDKLKLNKLFFYADFLNYKKTGKSISGITYRAIQYGPIPVLYEYVFTMLESNNIIEAKFNKDDFGGVKEIFVPLQKGNDAIFTEEERETINEVIEKFKDTSTWDLVELSHKEKAWKDLNKTKGIISYQEYAFNLKGI